jgi:hypothetical protein
MWSTVTATPFFSPQSFAKASTHWSYSGTKWLHWMIFSVFVSARARDMKGAEIAGAKSGERQAGARLCQEAPPRKTMPVVCR